MMMPTELVDRPVDALLAAYAAGVLEPALMALVRAHLELRPEGLAYVAGLEAAGGRWLEALEPRPLVDRGRRLAAALADVDERCGRAASAVAPDLSADDILPPSLRRYLGRGFDALDWTLRPDGARACVIAEDDGSEVVVLSVSGGTVLPPHAHAGLEVTLVLSGGFSDDAGSYARGDICIADWSRPHRPVIDPGDDCVCFAVTIAGVRLARPTGRFLQLLVR